MSNLWPVEYIQEALWLLPSSVTLNVLSALYASLLSGI